MRYSRVLLFLFLAIALYPRFAKADDSDGKVTVLGQLGVVGDSKTHANHFLFGGGGYYHPFSAKTSFVRRLSFGGEFDMSILSNKTVQDPNLGTLRQQDRLWLISPMARFDALSFEHVRVTLYGGDGLIRRTQVLEARNSYGQWTNINQYGYSCTTCQSSARFEPGGGVSVAWAKHKDSKFSVPGRFMYYRSGLWTVTAGVQYTF